MSGDFNPHAGDLTIQALQRNGEYYSEVLSLFQQNHDQCVSSEFFPQETITEIDACGLNFRKLGLESISVAKAVSAQWISNVLILYKYIGDYPIEDIKSQLVLLGGQAKELGRLFQVLEEWARYVAGRIHSLYKQIEVDIEDFKAAFSREVEDADLKLSQARNLVREKKDELEDKKAEEDRWKYSLYASSIGYALFFFVGAGANIITGIGYGVAKAAKNSAQDAVYEAETSRNEAQKKFDAATTKKEKAEVSGVYKCSCY